jgi:hypothetical protein
MFFEENRILHISIMFTPLVNLSNEQDGEGYRHRHLPSTCDLRISWMFQAGTR